MNYYNEIKNKLIDNEVYKRVKDYSKNRNELSTYYEVGRLLIEAQGGENRAKYGNGLIKEYSKRLTSELGKAIPSLHCPECDNFMYCLKKLRHCRNNYLGVITQNYYHLMMLMKLIIIYL